MGLDCARKRRYRRCLARLFNIESKHDLKKYCRKLIVRQSDLVALILLGRTGSLEPYRYASYFAQQVPEHLRTTDEERGALSRDGVGPLKEKALKSVSKMFQILEERRCFSGHLFYTPYYTYWYLFYSDQRDEAVTRNHWRGGPHVHLTSSHWPSLSLEKVWEKVKCGHINFPSFYVRFLADDNEPSLPGSAHGPRRISSTGTPQTPELKRIVPKPMKIQS
jgi:hypothetical protein